MSLAKLRRRLARNDQLVKKALGLILILLTSFLVFKVGAFLRGWWPHLREVINVVIQADPTLKSANGRTNILLLGIGGQEHSGSDLTDAIILVSFSPPDQKKTAEPIYLLSIPRDVYLPDIDAKVNLAYHLAREKDPTTALLFTKSVVSQITGLPVHYAVVVDFAAFEKIIDVVGGIDVTVETTFDDYFYPIPGKENDPCDGDPTLRCRFEHLHFAAGPVHMTGETALKFARSRNAESPEGSDFARAKRQQKILAALKSKIFTFTTLLSPNRFTAIYTALSSNIDTDIDVGKVSPLVKSAIRYRQSPIKNITLDEGLFDQPPVDQRGWILLPKDQNFSQIHETISKELFPPAAQQEGSH